MKGTCIAHSLNLRFSSLESLALCAARRSMRCIWHKPKKTAAPPVCQMCDKRILPQSPAVWQNGKLSRGAHVLCKLLMPGKYTCITILHIPHNPLARTRKNAHTCYIASCIGGGEQARQAGRGAHGGTQGKGQECGAVRAGALGCTVRPVRLTACHHMIFKHLKFHVTM